MYTETDLSRLLLMPVLLYVLLGVSNGVLNSLIG
jgi:hypothetical protein